MQYPKPLGKLIGELGKLPGIGSKTAQRLAFHILSLEDSEADSLADSIVSAKHSMRYCSCCGNLTEKDPCDICSDESRNKDVICVVETAQDVMAMERIKEFHGKYHGPEDINLQSLIVRLQKHPEVKELILATNPNIEGEATAMYIARLLKPSGIKVSRIAHGLPVGAELEYADEVTLLKAIEGRTEL